MKANFKSLAIGAVLVATMALGTGANAANLVTNGGFETGDLTGWLAVDTSFAIYVVNSPVQEGRNAAQIAGFFVDVGTDNENSLSQVIATTAGQSYELSFWYYQDQSSPNGLNVTWNGDSVYSATDEMVSGYQHITTAVVGGGSDSLVFKAYNDPAFTYLDNVSLSASVPEPGGWALMIGGLGVAGAMLRRRRSQVALTA
jgi:hypothetical protein